MTGGPVTGRFVLAALLVGSILASSSALAASADSGAIREVAATTIEALAGSPLRD